MVGSWHYRIDHIRLCYSNQASSTRSPLRLSGKANWATARVALCVWVGAGGVVIPPLNSIVLSTVKLKSIDEIKYLEVSSCSKLVAFLPYWLSC
jgi:hypothetical protein